MPERGRDRRRRGRGKRPPSRVDEANERVGVAQRPEHEVATRGVHDNHSRPAQSIEAAPFY